MWMMTTLGFFSAVEYDGNICIRARKRSDLAALVKFIRKTGEYQIRPNEKMISHTPLQDYKYRINLTKDLFERLLPHFGSLVNYPNFKNEVRKTNPERENLYHQLWVLLLRIEREKK